MESSCFFRAKKEKETVIMKKKKDENYIERIPKLKESFKYGCNDEGKVTLEIENKGVMNFIMQKLLFKPKVSYIHLDEFGSFAVLQADGERDIYEIGKLVEEKFGERANPLYERLSKFFQIMDSYGFIDWK